MQLFSLRCSGLLRGCSSAMNRLFEHDVDLRKTDPTARCPFATAGLLPFLQFSVAGAAHCCRSAPSSLAICIVFASATQMCLVRRPF